MAQATFIEELPEFKPVKIEIAFDTQDELDFFGVLFNYVPIVDALKVAGAPELTKIRGAVEDAGGNVHRLDKVTSVIEKKVKAL